MTSRLSILALAGALLFTTPACVIQRQIKAVDAHPTANNYKVQTATVRLAVFVAWQTWEVWTCHREGEKFVCDEADYDTAKQGIQWSGGPTTAPAPASAPAPAPAPSVLPPTPAPAPAGGA
jgi:hypothetical protein